MGSDCAGSKATNFSKLRDPEKIPGFDNLRKSEKQIKPI